MHDTSRWVRPADAFLLLALLASAPVAPAEAQSTVSICGRTAAVRDKILATSGASDCASVTSSQLASVSALKLGNSNITALKSGDFGGLTGLNRLELVGNNFDSLPSDVFSGLSSLRVLQMSYSSLDTLQSGLFSGLGSLIELNVSHNDLTALPPDVFSGLGSLIFLFLDGNDIAALPSDVFSDLSSLQLLFLYGNNFTTFPANTFSDLASLTWLTLEGGALTSVPSGGFSRLARLDKLDLSNNSLGSLPSNALAGSTVIKDLVLSGNSLDALPDSLFHGLTSLRTLWLHDNDVDPMPLEVSLVSTSDGNVKATVAAGAPFEIIVPLSATNGTLGDGNRITIPAGAVESSAFTVTPDSPGATVTVDVGTLPGLPATGEYTHYWGERQARHHGYELKRSADLPLTQAGQSAPAAVTLVLSSTSISENGGSTSVTATASPAPGSAFSVTVSAAAVSPATSGDFTLSGNTLSFAAGDSTSTGTVTITANDDNVDAADKSVTVSGTIATSGANATAPAARTLTITDDDAASTTITLSVDPDEVAEDDSGTPITVTGTLNASASASATDVTVSVGSGNGTNGATSGTDFAAVDHVTLTIAAGSTSGTAIFTLTPTDDSDVEADETVSVTGSATGLSVTATSITITNDDRPPFTAEFLNVPASHNGDSTFTFELRFSEHFTASYKKIRDRTLNVTGGTVTRAGRLVKKDNRRWNITIEPSSDDSVAIVLPSRPCSQRWRAICTDDDRQLAEAVSATVSGPTAGSDMGGTPARIVLDVTPEAAAAALLGDQTLSGDQLTALDRLGNGNGRYDLGDLLSWMARCDSGDPSCAPHSPSPPGEALPGTTRSGRTGNRRKRPDRGAAAGCRHRSNRARHSAYRRQGICGRRLGLAVLTATLAWACTDGGTVSLPVDPEPDPGFLTVGLAAPADAGAIGVLLELSGPAMDSLRAPGRDLIDSDGGTPRRVIVAGSLSSGPLLQLWVPDRRIRAQYQVRVLDVASEDFSVEGITEYAVLIR